MLDTDDLRIDVGRGLNGGDIMRMVHLPTGIERSHPGPMMGLDRNELNRWLVEIEAEVAALEQIARVDSEEIRRRIADYNAGRDPGFSEEEVGAKVKALLRASEHS